MLQSNIITGNFQQMGEKLIALRIILNKFLDMTVISVGYYSSSIFLEVSCEFNFFNSVFCQFTNGIKSNLLYL